MIYQSGDAVYYSSYRACYHDYCNNLIAYDILPALGVGGPDNMDVTKGTPSEELIYATFGIPELNHQGLEKLAQSSHHDSIPLSQNASESGNESSFPTKLASLSCVGLPATTPSYLENIKSRSLLLKSDDAEIPATPTCTDVDDVISAAPISSFDDIITMPILPSHSHADDTPIPTPTAATQSDGMQGVSTPSSKSSNLNDEKTSKVNEDDSLFLEQSLTSVDNHVLPLPSVKETNLHEIPPLNETSFHELPPITTDKVTSPHTSTVSTQTPLLDLYRRSIILKNKPVAISKKSALEEIDLTSIKDVKSVATQCFSDNNAAIHQTIIKNAIRVLESAKLEKKKLLAVKQAMFGNCNIDSMSSRSKVIFGCSSETECSNTCTTIIAGQPSELHAGTCLHSSRNKQHLPYYKVYDAGIASTRNYVDKMSQTFPEDILNAARQKLQTER